jgi:hypothetical protein
VYGLLKFLRHEPWCESSFWKNAITSAMSDASTGTIVNDGQVVQALPVKWASDGMSVAFGRVRRDPCSHHFETNKGYSIWGWVREIWHSYISYPQFEVLTLDLLLGCRFWHFRQLNRQLYTSLYLRRRESFIMHVSSYAFNDADSLIVHIPDPYLLLPTTVLHKSQSVFEGFVKAGTADCI